MMLVEFIYSCKSPAFFCQRLYFLQIFYFDLRFICFLCHRVKRRWRRSQPNPFGSSKFLCFFLCLLFSCFPCLSCSFFLHEKIMNNSFFKLSFNAKSSLIKANLVFLNESKCN